MTATQENTMTNGNPPKVKPDGRITTLEKTVADMQVKLDTLIWLHADMAYKLKVAAAQQLLQNPAVQEKLQAAIIAKMSGE